MTATAAIHASQLHRTRLRGEPAPPRPEWALYARISNDRKDGAGVDRQVEAALRWAAAAGVTIAEGRRYIDNDISASSYSRRRRPGYGSLLEAARRGELAGVVVFKLDRLYRRPMELEEVIPTGLRICCTDDSDCDLGTPAGQLMGRLLAAVGANEVSSMSVRTRAQRAQERARGVGGHAKAFGWRSPEEVDPEQMRLIREAAERLTAGATLNSIAADWNRRGVQRLRSKRGWSRTVVRTVLANPRHAGLLTHRGEVLDVEPAFRESNAGHLMPQELHQRVLETLETNAGNGADHGRRRWLGGVLVCGRCGESLVSKFAQGGRRGWACIATAGGRACGRLRVTADPVEAVVREAVFFKVDRADLAAAAGQKHRSEADEATVELRRVERLRTALYQHVEEGLIGQEEQRRRLAPLRRREEAARQRLSAAQATTGPIAPFAGRVGVLRRAWVVLTEEEKRGIVRSVFGTVTILPSTKRGRHAFQPSRVVLATPPVSLPLPMTPRGRPAAAPRANCARARGAVPDGG